MCSVILMAGEPLLAQGKDYPALDLTRIQREVNLMETILADMLSNGYRLSQPFSDSRVRGVYVPAVGMIFRVSTSPYITSMQYYMRTRSGEKRDSQSGVYIIGPGGEIAKTNAASYRALIDSTIFEFLEYYADASGQLDDQEKVIVVYEPGTYVSALALQGNQSHALGSATFSAKKADIASVRARKLDRERFVQKIAVTDAQQNKQVNERLRRFASVCKAMLNDNEQQNGYRIYGEVSNLFLDDFGAIYMFDAVKSVQTPHNIIIRIQDEIRRQEQVVQQLSERARKKDDSRDVDEILAQLQAESDAKRSKDDRKAYEEFEQRISDLMLSYGRSLQMLDADQMLTVAVKILDNPHLVPERVVFQLKKNDLTDFDAGKIDRATMLKKVSIKRYGASVQ